MGGKLSFIEVLSICIGSVIGTGIFFVPGIAAGLLGPGSVFAWIAIAALSIPMGYSFAELASMFTKSGGPMIYAKEAFGSFWGFIAGWTTWILATVTISTLALAIAYFGVAVFPSLMGLEIPIALASLAVLTLVNYLGAKMGARVQVILTASTVLLFLAFLVLGFPKIDLSNFRVFFPLGLGSLGLALAFVLEPFVGWEAGTLVAGEIRNPRKVLPKAIAITTIFIALLYVVIVFVALGTGGWVAMAESSTPLSEAIAAGTGFVVVASLIINIAALNSWIFTNSRLPCAMAHEKLFMDSYKKLSKFGTPSRSLLLQAFIAGLIIVPGSYEASILLLLSSAFILYLISFLSLIALRKTADAKFRSPRVFPHIGVIALILLFTQIEWHILLFGLLIVLIGIPGYVTVKLLTDRKFIERFWDRFNMVLDIYHPLFYGHGELRKTVRNARLRTGHKVLDYGCGGGVSTEAVAEKVRKGTVVAADLSQRQLKRSITRMSKKRISNVMFVKISRPAPFPKESFDRIVCTIAIDYFVHPKKELAALARTLKKGGIASFMAVRAPTLPLHKFLLKDSNIKSVFRRSGFRSVKIERAKRPGREYIYIIARK